MSPKRGTVAFSTDRSASRGVGGGQRPGAQADLWPMWFYNPGSVNTTGDIMCLNGLERRESTAPSTGQTHDSLKLTATC